MSDLKIIIANKRYSSWSLRGWLAIEHTGLPYKEILLPLDTPVFYEEIVKYNPAMKVPTLLDGSIAVWDSAAIIDYCTRLAPNKFWWPTDKEAYAYARSIFNEMHSGFNTIRSHMPMNLQGQWQNLSLNKTLETEVRRIETIWSECRKKYGSTGAFLFGDFSAVDMMFAPVTARFATYGIQVNETANAYIKSVRQHPSVAAWYAAAIQETEVVPADQLDLNITHLG